MSIWKRSLYCLVTFILGLPVAGAASFEPLPLLDPGAVSGRFYQNPHSVYDIGDPFILPAEGHFYLFATGGTVGFNVWRTKDLRSFDKQKALPKVSWASGDYWAPEVVAYDGRYVMLFTARRKADKSLRIGIALADTPEGPYTDPLDAPLFDLGYAAIDATLLMDGDIPYLYYVRDCSENVVRGRHESHIYGVRMSPDLLSMEGEPVLLTVPDQEWEMEQGGDYLWNEGPAVLVRDGLYYLFYSAHFFADKRYGVGVAVSEHPLGPFTKQQNNPLLWYIENETKVMVSGPGHNSFFMVGDELFTAYHTHTYPLAPSGNRQLNIDRAGFHADGTAFIDGPARVPKLLPFSMTGLVNHAPEAVGEGIAPLADADTCSSPASAHYAWRGTNASLKWDVPRTADMLMLCFAGGNTAAGQLVINERFTVDVGSGGTADNMLILHFAPMAIESLRMEWDGEVSVGELYVIGSAE